MTVTTGASRTCCGSWRRRSSARSSAGTGTSTWPRTRSRRRCSPPRRSGRATGVPDNPRGWLITVASRRLTDLLRSEQARRRREDDGRASDAAGAVARAGRRPADPGDADDTLVLLFLCCHPALSPASQIALTLRAVGGLTTAEIARAFLVPEATMTRRITRAKQPIRDSGVPFRLPPGDERGRAARRRAARALPDLQRGLRGTSGPALHRAELAAEAIRLTRLRAQPAARRRRGRRPARADAAHRRPPAGPHRAGRRAGPDGRAGPQPLGRARRSPRASRSITRRSAARADRAVPAPGGDRRRARRGAAAPRTPTGRRSRALYELLLRLDDNPVVALNHAVAVAMVRRAAGRARAARRARRGPADGRRPPAAAVRAHLLEMAGDTAAARDAYRAAARSGDRRRAPALPQRAGGPSRGWLRSGPRRLLLRGPQPPPTATAPPAVVDRARFDEDRPGLGPCHPRWLRRPARRRPRRLGRERTAINHRSWCSDGWRGRGAETRESGHQPPVVERRRAGRGAAGAGGRARVCPGLAVRGPRRNQRFARQGLPCRGAAPRTRPVMTSVPIEPAAPAASRPTTSPRTRTAWPGPPSRRASRAPRTSTRRSSSSSASASGGPSGSPSGGGAARRARATSWRPTSPASGSSSCATGRAGSTPTIDLCRHRGSRLTTADQRPDPETCDAPGPSGTFKGIIRCTYHSWCYELDGEVRNAPFLGEADHFEPADFGLHRSPSTRGAAGSS